MLLNTDTSHSLAGIAVAFAGFTGIVLALRSSGEEESASVAQSRLVDLLFASLGVVFFAFLPEAVVGFISDQAATWRICALLFAIYHVTVILIAAKVGGI